ncbi:uncharacterized protein LOC127728132 [Mytilus californianus]|uniref:uncharacterized protein LOC127728132 n=1 Tax=Mytilus californianus TaxID=6549 RepID=UPI0022457544|nr:uncharacterized protein LOC127728132 [Mytilus californianus]
MYKSLQVIWCSLAIYIVCLSVWAKSCSEDGACNDVVTMPLTDNLGATLKADLDVKNLNKHLKAYIELEMKKVFEATAKNVRTLVEKEIEELNSTVQENLSGVTYIRWGRKDCPSGAELVYTGQAGGNHYMAKGGGVNYLCLPNDPENGEFNSYGNDQIYGSEYEISYAFTPTGWPKSIHNKEVPCSVCFRKHKSAMIMIPGRKTCYRGWNTEYHGYLMSDHVSHVRVDYACVDRNPEPMDTSNTINEDGALLYTIRAKCGSLKCPPYTNGAIVLCSVCTK